WNQWVNSTQIASSYVSKVNKRPSMRVGVLNCKSCAKSASCSGMDWGGTSCAWAWNTGQNERTRSMKIVPRWLMKAMIASPDPTRQAERDRMVMDQIVARGTKNPAVLRAMQ